MNLPPPGNPDVFSPHDCEVLTCLISAPTQEVAAEWLGLSATHLRRRLKDLRVRANVETNAQLIVLASISGIVDPTKVLPYGQS